MPRSPDGLYKCRRCKQRFSPDGTHRICLFCRGLCSSCGTALTAETQDTTGFRNRKQYQCKRCVADRVRRTRGNRGFSQRDYDLRRQYGITQDEYSKRYNDQSGRCAICQTPHPLLVIDHCHSTGAVRELLCPACNLGLGFFKDNRAYLRNAMDYLDVYQNPVSEG